MAGKKKRINNTNIPEHEIEKIARCLLPDILVCYNSEEGQKEFAEWKINHTLNNSYDKDQAMDRHFSKKDYSLTGKTAAS